jgi:group I intron endonuclease
MTSGIYKLNFNGTDKVYIGQSVLLERRLYQHVYGMRKGTSSYKLNQAYKNYGPPTLEILEHCLVENLNTQEKHYISKFNSVAEGFNTINDFTFRVDLQGDKHVRSLYSNEKIIEALNCLVDSPHISIQEASETLHISSKVISHIMAGTSHTWLNKEFPEKYVTLMSLKGTRNSFAKSAAGKGIIYPTILSPDNIKYDVTNVTQFSKTYNLDTGALHRVLTRKAKSHKGWKLANFYIEEHKDD